MPGSAYELRQPAVQRVILWLKLTCVLVVGVFIALVVLKNQSNAEDYFVLSQGYHIVHVVTGGFLLLLFGSFFGCYLHRVRVCLRARKAWSDRRWTAITRTSSRAAVMLFILLTYLAANLYVLVRPEAWCSGSDRVVPTTAWLRWCGWTLLLASFVLDAHSTNLRPSGKRPDASVRDEPLWFHWPLFLIAAAICGAVTWVYVLSIDSKREFAAHVLDGGECTWGASLTCSVSDKLKAATTLVLVGHALFLALFVFYSTWTWHQLHNRLYQDFRLSHIIMRLQFRMYMAGFSLIVLTTLILWGAGGSPCLAYGLSWFGMLPALLMTPTLLLAQMFVTMPRHPGAPPPAVAALLQDFAWTEAQVPRKLEKREATIVCPQMRDEPMFCIETAIKLFYWASLIYDYTEAAGHQFTSMPAAIRAVLGDMKYAMQFYGLSKRRMFYDRTAETKILVAWSDRTIVLSCRGSITRANFIADAKLMLSHHPPKRLFEGTHPKVHTGFLKTWTAGDINQKILQHVKELLASAEDPSTVQILLTGHSLGGAIAQLAAVDMAKTLALEPSQIKVYTFGCPRAGNRTFAREYEHHVPDTWHIINDQDVVTTAMKLGVYKRAGHRVIINAHGDLIVRPTFIELSLLQTPFHSSVMSHHTSKYQDALRKVISTQLTEKRRHADGLEGVAELLESAPIVREALDSADRGLAPSFLEKIRNLGHMTVDNSSAGTALQRVRTLGRSSRAYSGRLHGDGTGASDSAGDYKAVGALDDEAAATQSPAAGPQAGDGDQAAAAAASPESIKHRCYAILEDGSRSMLSSAQTVGSGSAAPAKDSGSAWRCPLTCKDSELPDNACVHGSVLEIGEAPNMRSCKLPGSPAAWHSPMEVLAERRAARDRREAARARPNQEAGSAEPRPHGPAPSHSAHSGHSVQGSAPGGGGEGTAQGSAPGGVQLASRGEEGRRQADASAVRVGLRSGDQDEILDRVVPAVPMDTIDMDTCPIDDASSEMASPPGQLWIARRHSGPSDHSVPRPRAGVAQASASAVQRHTGNTAGEYARTSAYGQDRYVTSGTGQVPGSASTESAIRGPAHANSSLTPRSTQWLAASLTAPASIAHTAARGADSTCLLARGMHNGNMHASNAHTSHDVSRGTAPSMSTMLRSAVDLMSGSDDGHGGGAMAAAAEYGGFVGYDGQNARAPLSSSKWVRNAQFLATDSGDEMLEAAHSQASAPPSAAEMLEAVHSQPPSAVAAAAAAAPPPELPRGASGAATVAWRSGGISAEHAGITSTMSSDWCPVHEARAPPPRHPLVPRLALHALEPDSPSSATTNPEVDTTSSELSQPEAVVSIAQSAGSHEHALAHDSLITTWAINKMARNISVSKSRPLPALDVNGHTALLTATRSAFHSQDVSYLSRDASNFDREALSHLLKEHTPNPSSAGAGVKRTTPEKSESVTLQNLGSFSTAQELHSSSQAVFGCAESSTYPLGGGA